MDFQDTPEELAYRMQVRAWLVAHAEEWKAARRGGAEDSNALAAAKAWQRRKADAGYACIDWPKEWGGPGGAVWQAVIFAQEEAAYDNSADPFVPGLGQCLPTVLSVASEALRQRFARPAIRGDEIWCQLFSEPAAGSDLAGVRTRAIRNGDTWVINGQKVWTTGAHYSDFGLLLARTDVDVPKHKGLTMFWIDMKVAGVTVRPIQQMTGQSEFNEVFFSDVQISDAQRLGTVNDGWRVSVITLMNERLNTGGSGGISPMQFLELARTVPGRDGTALSESAIREKIADWYIRSEGVKYMGYRFLTALSRGQTPGPENSVGKLVLASLMQDMAFEALQMAGELGIVSDPTSSLSAFQTALFYSPSVRIAGGTDEILRNIVAERVLALPPDLRVDKDIPFREIPF